MNLVEASVACKMAGLNYGQWRYLCEVVGTIKPPTAEEIEANMNRKKKHEYIPKYDGRAVTAYNLRGEPVITYPNIQAACIALGKPPANIRHACNGKLNTAYGFQWRYVGEEQPNCIRKKTPSILAPKVEAHCPECGTTFLGDKRRVYCSFECSESARHKRDMAFREKHRRQNRKTNDMDMGVEPERGIV